MSSWEMLCGSAPYHFGEECGGEERMLVMDVSGKSRRVPSLWTSVGDTQGVMNGEEQSRGWVRPTSRHLPREFVRRYGVRNSRSFVSKYCCRARFKTRIYS
ncbi:unnamed protein product [Litomosoides sigmodontis]|uniref:Uncharacterized protein n=1 Tax=Litomosoides sigmodontis TaxID=42156 RepID=A0A3P6TZQ8_LITSI|nr:unnamed protein product [Litomosoides sigmodontis]